MLRIPFDGPSLEGRRAIVSTGREMIRGVVVAADRFGVSLAVDGIIREIPASEVRVISPA